MVLQVPVVPEEDHLVAHVLEAVDTVPPGLGVHEEDRDLARLEVVLVALGLEYAPLGELVQQPREIRPELIDHDHGLSLHLGEQFVQGLQLLVVHGPPLLRTGVAVGLDEGVDIRGAVRDLEALLGPGRSAEGLGRPVPDLGEHFFLHLAVDLAGGRGQIHLHHVDDRLFQVEPVLAVDGQTEVLDRRVDLGVGPFHGLDTVAVRFRPEPALLERPVGPAEPLAPVEEPELAPQVGQPVRARGPGEFDESGRVGMGDVPESTGALAPLPRDELLALPAGLERQPQALQLRALVGHDRAVRPPVAPLLGKPDQVLVVRRVDRCVPTQGPLPLGHRADDRHDIEVREVCPLAGLRGPGLAGHAQGREDQGRVRLAGHVEGIEQREGGPGLAQPRLGPQRAAWVLERVGQHQILVLPGRELLGGFAHQRTISAHSSTASIESRTVTCIPERHIRSCSRCWPARAFSPGRLVSTQTERPGSMTR